MTCSHKAPNQLMNFNNCLHHFTFHTTYSNQIDTDMYYVHVANIIGAILWTTLRYGPASNMVRKVFFFAVKLACSWLLMSWPFQTFRLNICQQRRHSQNHQMNNNINDSDDVDDNDNNNNGNGTITNPTHTFMISLSTL